jgi:hypothetical protein
MLEDVTFPDLPHELTLDAAALAQQRRRDEVRKRMRNTMPPLPELRFEMAYLRSILPACRSVTGGSAAQDISDGKEVVLDWRRAAWVTVKDQVGFYFCAEQRWEAGRDARGREARGKHVFASLR